MTTEITSPCTETSKPAEAIERNCPNCQALLPVYEGYQTWCEQCNWNLHIPPPPPWESLSDRLYRTISLKSSQFLFANVQTGNSLTRRLTWAKMLAYAIAVGIHGFTILFFLLGLWLAFFALPSARLLGVIISLPCFGIVWILLPRMPNSKSHPLPRQQFPTLYGISDQIARDLGSPPIDDILYDLNFNAAFGQFGWRRKRCMILGIPLLAVLNGQEFVALMSHELAHGVNGDPNRGLVLRTAMSSLATAYSIFHPRNRQFRLAGIATFFLFIFNVVSWILGGLIWTIGYWYSQLLWYDSQRAEYLADWLAAKTSGTEAHLIVLNKVQLKDLFNNRLKSAYITRKGGTFFADFKREVSQVPEREFERLRRVELLSRAKNGLSHPPHAHRAEFLKDRPVTEAKVILSAVVWSELEQELEPFLQQIQNQIFALDELSFRNLFRISW